MRIAYLTNSDSAFMFGGVGTAVYTLGLFCERQGWAYNVYADRPVEVRRKFMPKEFYENFQRWQGHTFFDVKKIETGYLPGIKQPLTYFGSAYNFLRALDRVIPDLVIVGDPLTALQFYSFRIHEYIPCYVYLHWHEMLVDMKSTLFTRDEIPLYRAICENLAGFGFLTQAESNIALISEQVGIAAEVMPLSIDIREGVQPKQGISYLGGGDTVKNPFLAAKVLEAIHELHSEVPIYVTCGRGKDKLGDLFGDFAEIHYRLPRAAMQQKLDSVKVGIHTSEVEGFGIAVLEQMSRYPVVLHRADYCGAFPPCPVFDTVEEGVAHLERMYFDEDAYQATADACIAYAKEHYSFAALDQCLSRLVKRPLPKHSVRDDTIEKIKSCISLVAVPLFEFYKRMGWNSAVLGAQALKVCPPDVVQLLHGQEVTYVGEPGCRIPSKQLF